MSDCDVISLERDDLIHSQRSSSKSSLADDIEDDMEVSTTSNKSSVFDDSTKVDIHATLQMKFKEATLNFQHRFEYGREKTLKKLVDYCSKQLEFNSYYARPSVEVKEWELILAYDELSKMSITDFIDESAMEMDLTVDYSECPEVFWPFIHSLSMRTAEGSEAVRGSSADEVLRVAIAHFVDAKSGVSKTFAKDFECLSASLTNDHLNILVPTLIQIIKKRCNIMNLGQVNHRKRQAGLILLHITKTHGDSLIGFADQLSNLVHLLFLSCDLKVTEPRTFILARGFNKIEFRLDSSDCEFAAAYLPLLFQYVLRGRCATLLEFWPLLKEEIKQAEMEEKADLIPHLLFSIEQCLLHVDKANLGSDEVAKMEEMFEEEFTKYKEELAEFKEQRASHEQDEDTIDSDEEMTEDSDDEEETSERSEKKLDDDKKKKICSEATEIIQRIRRFPEQYCEEKDDECLELVIRHRKDFAVQWEELANFVVDGHPTDAHKHIALIILGVLGAKVLDQDETYLRRLVDFIVHSMENTEDKESRDDFANVAFHLLMQLGKGRHDGRRWMISPLLAALLKMAEEDVTSGEDEDEPYVASSLVMLAWPLSAAVELNPHLPRMFTLCKVLQQVFGKEVTTGFLRSEGLMNPMDCARMIRFRIAREAIIDSEDLAKMVKNFTEENKENLAKLKGIIDTRKKERAEEWDRIMDRMRAAQDYSMVVDGYDEESEKTDNSDKSLPESNADLEEE